MLSVSIVFIILVAVSTTKCENDTKRYYEDGDDELVLLHVMFRHGERTPEPKIFPTDLYYNDTYYPYGPGRLTNEGRRTSYNIGKRLRDTYGDFIGKIYEPSKVYARTSDYDRTKDTLQAVLAGLFPPKGVNRWSPDVNWQPIPFIYEPVSQDRVLRGKNFYCARYVENYINSLHSPAVLEYNEKSKDIYRYLSKKTGNCITKPRDVYFLYFVFKPQEEMGLKIPAWTKPVWPEFITNAVVQENILSASTPQLLRLAIGTLLGKIISDSYLTINKEPTVNGRKIYIYSGHETNISFMLMALNLYDASGVNPDGSTIVFELRKSRKNIYYFRILYLRSKNDEPEVLQVPGCRKNCPIDKFAELIKDHIATAADSC